MITMPEVQDIFNVVSLSGLSPDQRKAFSAIKNCRSGLLGSHVDRCDGCGHLEVSFNSCRNRHCPKCQGSKQMQWVQSQLSKLLPVPYFHVVFTLPDQLNTLIFQNQKLLYSLLLKCAGDTITELARNPKFLGAQSGATVILHTCGQNLSFHPHVHCIVPGGGLSCDGLSFLRSGRKFFIPVKVLSRKFKAVCANFLNFLDSLYLLDWVAFCKKSFKSPDVVVKYLGRYTHRVAIANSRIVKMDDGSVTFRWKDYKDNCRVKLMTLSLEEFTRRFLLHVLPSGLTRIRHYGLLSSRNLMTKLALCFRLSAGLSVLFDFSRSVKTCPSCGGVMAFSGLVNMASPVP